MTLINAFEQYLRLQSLKKSFTKTNMLKKTQYFA